MADDNAKVESKNNKLYKLYDKEKRKNKFCPKCGTGFYMAQHKDRTTCGKCGYMEKVSKE